MNLFAALYFFNCFFLLLQILRYPVSIGATQHRLDKKTFFNETQAKETTFTNESASTSKTSVKKEPLVFLQIENMQHEYDRKKNPKEIQALADEGLAFARTKRRIAKIIRRAAGYCL
jgi:hypothetical protein